MEASVSGFRIWKRALSAAFMALLFAAGCSYTLNMQLATADAGGQLTAVAVLDAETAAKLVNTKRVMREVAQQLLDFLSTGQVAELTTGELRMQVYALVPSNYRTFADTVLGYVSSRHLETGRVGPNNVSRLKAYLEGVIARCEKYLDTHHPGG